MAIVLDEKAPHIRGNLKLGGVSYAFGSGIDASEPHIPFGDYPITPGEIGAWGQAHGAIGVNHNVIWDPRLGRNREGIEIHCGHLPYLYSHGCVAINPNQWHGFKASLLEFIKEKKTAYLHVHADGAWIDEKRAVATIIDDPAMPSEEVMLYLPGMWSRYGAVKPEEVAYQVGLYAQLRGWKFAEIKISGDQRAAQYQAALHRIEKGDITALYGFSAGGYNVANLMANMAQTFRAKIKHEIIVGAPGAMMVHAAPDLVIFKDPPEGHIHGPEKLLAKAEAEKAGKTTPA